MPLLDPRIVKPAIIDAFRKLDPRLMVKNPVMFVVEVGAFLTLGYIVQMALGQSASLAPITYFIALDAWLFLTVLFANFATALAEARGKPAAMRYVQRLVKSMTEYSRDPAQLAQVRAEIADQLEK